MDPLKLSYFAGLLDADGCMRIFKRDYNGKRATIALRMTHKETVDYFAKTFGLKVYENRGPKIRAKIEAGLLKQPYESKAHCYRAYEICKMLLPYLVTKKKDAIKIIQFYENRSCAVCGKQITPKRIEKITICSARCKRRRKSEQQRLYNARAKEKEQMLNASAP